MFIYVNKNSEIINVSKTRENTTGQEIEVVDSLVPQDWQSYKYDNGEFVKNTDRDVFLQNVQKKEKIAELNKQRDQELKGFIINDIFINKEIIYDMSVVYNTLGDDEKVNWIDINNNQIELTKDELGALILEGRKKIEEIYFKYRKLKDEIA
jgi:hypothetical protein